MLLRYSFGGGMEEKPKEMKDPKIQIFEKLDRFLFYLLTAELGYMIFLIGLFLGFRLYDIINHSTLTHSQFFSSMLLLSPFLLSLSLNLLGGFTGCILHIQINHKGYPGTGHLINWIFSVSMAWWILIILIELVMPGYID
jgi:hypothetical protein